MRLLSIAILWAVCTTSSLAQAQSLQTPAVIELSWADLLPPGEAENISRLQTLQANAMGFDHFGDESMPQIQSYNTVEDLNGRRVRISGYVLPFEFSSTRQLDRFLLVPYVGACVHVPPPPPNQLVYVQSETSFEVEGLWAIVQVEGIMHIERHQNVHAQTAYRLELTHIEPYSP